MIVKPNLDAILIIVGTFETIHMPMWCYGVCVFIYSEHFVIAYKRNNRFIHVAIQMKYYEARVDIMVFDNTSTTLSLLIHDCWCGFKIYLEFWMQRNFDHVYVSLVKFWILLFFICDMLDIFNDNELNIYSSALPIYISDGDSTIFKTWGFVYKTILCTEIIAGLQSCVAVVANEGYVVYVYWILLKYQPTNNVKINIFNLSIWISEQIMTWFRFNSN